MTVYVLTEELLFDDDTGFRNLGVYATKELAKQALKLQRTLGASYDIEEWEVTE